jgi:Heavy metal associated domain 2
MGKYLHIIKGRIRIKLPQVKGKPLIAAQVARSLLEKNGITSAQANSVTGNVLVLFDPTLISQAEVLAMLRPEDSEQESRYAICPILAVGNRLATIFVTRMAESFGQHLAQIAIRVALERLIFTLL